MQSAVEKIPELKVHVMEDIDPEARLDGGDILFTGSFWILSWKFLRMLLSQIFLFHLYLPDKN